MTKNLQTKLKKGALRWCGHAGAERFAHTIEANENYQQILKNLNACSEPKALLINS